MTVLKNLLITLLALLAGGVTVQLLELPGSLAFPLPKPEGSPAGTMPSAETLRLHIQSLPLWPKLMVLLAWGLGPLVAAYVGRRFAVSQTPLRQWIPSLISILLFTAATVTLLITLPHPWWMNVLGPLFSLGFGFLGLGLASGRPTRIVHSQTINAAPQQVFQVLSTPESFQRAVPAIEKLEFLTQQTSGPGTRFKETRIINGRQAVATLEIGDIQPDHSVQMISDEGGVVWDTTFKVARNDSAPDTTRMEMTMDAKPYRFLARYLIPMIAGMITKAVAEDMECVRKYCETQQPTVT